MGEKRMKVEAINRRMFESKIMLSQYEHKLKQLTKASNLPDYMGGLLLQEIILSDDEANKHLRERAVYLGLAKEVKNV
jgi:hypothetical protein